MTTYTTIPDSSLEPGKPIRSIDALALRDNPLAIAEGASGAPRIIGKAAKRLSDFDVLSVSASDAYDAHTGSNFEDILSSTNSGSDVVVKRYTIEKYTGSIRFKLSHLQSGGVTAYLAIYKNNTLVQQYSTTSTSYVARINDVSISAGDVIEWRARVSNVAGSTSFTSESQTASNSYIEIPLYIQSIDF